MKALIRPLCLTAAVAAVPVLASDWETWSDCQYVASPSNSADSFRVRCGNREQTVRLYSVVASAVDLDAYLKHFGLTKALAQATAQQAVLFTQQQLADRPFQVITRQQPAGRPGAVYAYVLVGKLDLGRELASQGYAYEQGLRASRPGVSAMSYVASLRAAEEQARLAGRGAWSYARARAPTTNLQPDTGYRLSRPGEIRHNSDCPHYHLRGNTPCGSDAGTPCKLCGG